jgi:asparagine synthetase B (glutamine-hydrolysing)
MNSIGFEDPNSDEVGIVSACYDTMGTFALYKAGEYAARSRFGMSPLYWNPKTKKFSFRPSKGLEEFPPGHVYIFECDRLVCFDDPWFEKPLKTMADSLLIIRSKFNLALNRFIGKTDGFFRSGGCGSRLVERYLPDNIPSYTVGHVYGNSVDLEDAPPHTVTIHFDDSSHWPWTLEGSEIPMYILARFINTTTSHRKFITGLGCTELFSGTQDFRPRVDHIADQCALFGIDVWSPFLDIELVEYVLDYTSPDDRPGILKELLDGDVRDTDGQDIEATVGTFISKKTWWYF